MPASSLPNPPNRCACGHDSVAHVAGSCIQCGGGTGNVHGFVPEKQINNPGFATGRGGFASGDPQRWLVAAEPTNTANQPNATGPARPPNGQRAG